MWQFDKKAQTITIHVEKNPTVQWPVIIQGPNGGKIDRQSLYHLGVQPFRSSCRCAMRPVSPVPRMLARGLTRNAFAGEAHEVGKGYQFAPDGEKALGYYFRSGLRQLAASHALPCFARAITPVAASPLHPARPPLTPPSSLPLLLSTSLPLSIPASSLTLVARARLAAEMKFGPAMVRLAQLYTPGVPKPPVMMSIEANAETAKTYLEQVPPLLSAPFSLDLLLADTLAKETD